MRHSLAQNRRVEHNELPPPTPESVRFHKSYNAHEKSATARDVRADHESFAVRLGADAVRILADTFGELWILSQLQAIRESAIAPGTITDPGR